MKQDLERVLHGEPVVATPILPAERSTQVLTGPVRDTAVLPVPVEDERRKQRRRVAAWILIGLLVLGALVVGLILLATSLIGSTPTVKVPEVVGLNVEAAKIELQSARLKSAITIKPSKQPVDTVIAQSPDPNTEVKEGTKVQLTVSGGPQQVAVPDLAGTTPTEAAATLSQKHLALGQQLGTDPSDTVKKGRITRTQPPAGQQVAAGTAIDYFVSSGPAPVGVSDVTCLRVSDATTQLEDDGFNVEDGGEDPNGPNQNCPDSNFVSRTEPPANSGAAPGATVTIFRSFPPPTPTGSPTPSISPSPTATKG